MSQSLFPEQVDHFQRFIEPDLEAQSLIQQYKSLISAGKTTEAKAILEKNPRLKQMIINADTLNLFLDSVENTQTIFKEIEPYIFGLAKYQGVWSEKTKYSRYSVVTYGIAGGIEAFLAIEREIPIGTLPTNKNYWISITARGEQGASGTGMAQRGVWNNYTTYYKDDCVSYNNKMWAALKENINIEPGTSSSDWVFIMEVRQQVQVSDTQPNTQDIGDIWCRPGDALSGFSFFVMKSDGDYQSNYLATLVDGKIPEEQLPMTGGTFVGSTPPENKKLTWIDISLGESSGIQKYWNGTEWTPVLAVWG